VETEHTPLPGPLQITQTFSLFWKLYISIECSARAETRTEENRLQLARAIDLGTFWVLLASTNQVKTGFYIGIWRHNKFGIKSPEFKPHLHW
jgi:hypothetical protein